MTLKEKLQQTPNLSMQPVAASDQEGLYITVSGDWNDGDWVTETSLIDIDASTSQGDIEQILKDIYENDAKDYQPSGIPDNAEFHTIDIEEIYFLDADGLKYDIVYEG